MSKLFQLIFIILVTTIAYSSSIGNGFVIDDKTFILDWPLIRDFHGTKEFFQGAVPLGHEGVYRPLRSIIYAIDYNLFGTNPVGYHIQSILIHLFSTILIYFIVLELLKRKNQQFNNVAIQQSIIPFAASLLFGLHPIHTETIDYIAASMETFGTVFFFASFYLYLRFSNETTKPSLTRFSNRYFLLSLLFAFLAFFTYEMTLTLPLLILLYELCFNTQIQNSSTNSLRVKGKALSVKRKVSFLSPFPFTLYPSILNFQRFIPYFTLAFIYLFIRFFALGITSRGPYLANSFYLTMLTMTKVFVKYISLLLLPINQANNHIISKGIEAFVYRDYRTEAILHQSFFDLQIIFSLFILIALIIFAVKYVKKYPVISFAIGWFFISLLPVSEIVPQGSMLNEKLLYIPSFGFILLLVFTFDKSIKVISEKIQNAKIKMQNDNAKFKIFNSKLQLLTLHFAFLTIAITYSYLTFQRNFDWKDEITLWTKDLAVYPTDNAYAHFALGNAYTAQKQYSKALEQYQKTVATNPKFAVGVASVARSYTSMGNNDQAIIWYKKALDLNPSIWEAQYNIGNLYLQQNKIKEAITAYQKAIELNPNFLPVKQAYEKLSGSPVITNSLPVIASDSAAISKITSSGTPRNENNQPSLNDLLSLPSSGNTTSSPQANSSADFTVSFSYPKGWEKKDSNGAVIITNGDRTFTVLIKRDTKQAQTSLDQYIQGRTDSYGTLINQGLAKIPNVDIAYVKIWSDKSISKHQFFLFKENKIVEIIAYPSDSTLMKDFDTILGSLQF